MTKIMPENCIKCGSTQDLSEYTYTKVDKRIASVSGYFRTIRRKTEITNVRERTVLVCSKCKRKFKNNIRYPKISKFLIVLFPFFICWGLGYIAFATHLFSEGLSQGIGGIIAMIIGIIMLTSAIILSYKSKRSINHPDFIIAEQYYRDAMERKLVDPKDSLHHFDKALILFPKYKEVYYEKGEVYQQLGRFRSALENFNRALKIDPLYEKAKIARQEVLQALSAKQTK